MTTETTYTCPGTDVCEECGEPYVAESFEEYGHEFVPHTHTAECDAEVWRAVGCDANVSRGSSGTLSPIVFCDSLIDDPGGPHDHQELAPIMSAPETEAAWLGARVLLAGVDSWPEGNYKRVRFMSSMARSLRLEPNGGASYGALVALTKATPAAIGVAFKEAMKHG